MTRHPLDILLSDSWRVLHDPERASLVLLHQGGFWVDMPEDQALDGGWEWPDVAKGLELLAEKGITGQHFIEGHDNGKTFDAVRVSAVAEEIRAALLEHSPLRHHELGAELRQTIENTRTTWTGDAGLGTVPSPDPAWRVDVEVRLADLPAPPMVILDDQDGHPIEWDFGMGEGPEPASLESFRLLGSGRVELTLRRKAYRGLRSIVAEPVDADPVTLQDVLDAAESPPK